ncbi:MAG: iron-containing alcohol dehydrogenase [Candidatus Diapherotrites archaeon]|nr:iron-containing alcohol dehydrogenase [Candidatus Diapherotrites archaeon]
MNFREIDLPSRVVLKPGIIGQLHDVLADLGYDRPAYIVDKYTEEHFLPEGGEACRAPEATISVAESAASCVGDADVVVGIGGGKNIDIAKYVGWKRGIPVVSVPTIPSHDGLASPMISLSDSGKPYSQYFRPPHYVLVDPDVLCSAPDRFVQAGFGDVIGKYTSVYDWWIAHVDRGEYFGRYSASLAYLTFRHVVRARRQIARKTPEGINVLMEALVTNGIVMGIQHSSRPASGSEHLISHALDYLRGKKWMHGLQVGVGTIVAAYFQGRDWERIRKFLEGVGAPTTAEGLGISDEMMVRAVAIAKTLRDRYTILHRLDVDEHLARQALRATEVI